VFYRCTYILPHPLRHLQANLSPMGNSPSNLLQATNHAEGSNQRYRVLASGSQENHAKEQAKKRAGRLASGRYDQGGTSWETIRIDDTQAACASSPPRSSDDGLSVTQAVVWMRPVKSAIGSALGGEHSFIVLQLSDKSHHLIEKHHDGSIEFRVFERREVIDLALKNATKMSGYRKEKTALFVRNMNGAPRESHLKEITLGEVRRIAQEHEGDYDVHDKNCHVLTHAIWNALVIDRKALKHQFQPILTRFARFFGVSASIRSDAQARQQTVAPAIGVL
jgi:hypothetical protein